MGYVDDTKIFLHLRPNQISDTVIALNKDFSAIARWCCANPLVINPGKTPGSRSSADHKNRGPGS